MVAVERGSAMALIIVSSDSGQHATVVYEAAILSGENVLGFATIGDAEPPTIFDCPWIGSVTDIAGTQIVRENDFIIACGSNAQRRQQSEILIKQGASLRSVCHPAAIVSPSASIGSGSALLAGAVVGPRTSLGIGAIVNHAASIDHDCEIADYLNVCPGGRLAGCVQAGSNVFVGINASILQGLKIGKNAVIGAGAVVTRDVAAGETVIGVPARSITHMQS
ncbi:MAG: NeuD/PglB/VioB family sugar acetyltransferase [Sphingomonadaceae bacterium]